MAQNYKAENSYLFIYLRTR